MVTFFWPWGVFELLAVLLILCIAAIEILFRGIPDRAHRPVLYLLLISAIWVFLHAIEISSSDVVAKEIAHKLQVPSLITTATVYLVFVSRYYYE